MLLSNKVYDILKWIAQYLLPASGTLYFALAAIWGLPYGEQIVGTISALTIFLGVILGISSNSYIKSGADTDGTLQIDTSNPQKDIYRMQFNGNVENLGNKKRVIFTVDKNSKLSS
jgi:hypothetical protein